MSEEKEYLFEFSVVMAVYNVEPFLREAVDSLIGQDFGFEKIQLIMVDDGSTDDSGVICDEYAAQYPKNVMVIHKENEGVSSARNEGLKYAQGRYVNFLDSDDKLDKETMTAVHKFFLAHREETDVVALPMFFFDGVTGPHRQNAKFDKGTRVINLIQEWQTVQLSCASAFVKAEKAKEMNFDTKLVYCEDGKEIQKILMEKMTLGVIAEVSYRYRRRTLGTLSAIQSAEENIYWYTPYLEGFTASVISDCLERKGYIPKYVQYSLMYDIQWRVRQEHIPNTVMKKEDAERYKEYLFSFLKYFDDDVIMAQKDIQIEHKAYLLKKKYGREADILWGHNDAVLHYKNTFLTHLNSSKTHFDFISMARGKICLEGFIVLLTKNYADVKIFLEVNGEKIPCELTQRNANRMALGDPIYFSYGFRGELTIDSDVEIYKITVFCEIDGKRVNRSRLLFGKFSPISAEYKRAYYYRNGYVLTTDEEALYVQKCGRMGRILRECCYLKELWVRNKIGARKAVLARLLNYVLRLFIHKKIWIISDRINQADDNGEAFFQYMSELSLKDRKVYFALSPQSPDYARMKKMGKVIPFLGKRYKILYLLADCIISSQAEEYIFHPFQEYSGLYRDLAQTQKFVFLQHGIIHNDLSNWLSRFNKNISMFVTTTEPEYRFVLTCGVDYTSDVVKLTGMPRYDRLTHCEKKMITIIPTWRKYLVTEVDAKTGERKLKPGYRESKYFVMYDELLNNQRLFDEAQKHGYKIAFLCHPNMICAKEELVGDPRLHVLDNKTSYRKIFAESDLLVTDYSSVTFDFAYLRKPVVYYQQDKEEFYSGAHTVGKGYFDHTRDGFGEVEYSAEALVDRIIEYMENDCKLKDKYRERIDAIFPFSDTNNCRRVYEEILNLQ